MMQAVELSVIVLTCNRPERCRDSLRKNQAALSAWRCEWLIVNNGAADFTLPPDLPAPSRLLQMPRNLGTEARNTALNEARGTYILVLDDDAYIPAGTLAPALRALHTTAAAGGIILPVENEGCLLPTIFHGCAALFRRTALQSIGGYPPNYGYYGEEYDITFRLIAAGHRLLPVPPDTPPVHHARDPAGRNPGNILYRLIRNNTFCWARYLPLKALPHALYDTLYRYRHVARRENARRGFARGLLALPAALLRGLRQRTPLHPAEFESLSLNAAVRQAARTLRKRGLRRVVLCGLGKLPSGWFDILQRQGIEIRAVTEQNPAFHGRHFRRVAIRPPQELDALIDPSTAFLCGTVAAPANRFWTERLAQAGLRPDRAADPVQCWRLPAARTPTGVNT